MEKLKRNMKTIPESERPYERCLAYGAEALTDAQLLAVILKNGSRQESAVELAQRLLNHNELQGGLSYLNHMKLPDFMSYPGIGQVKAITLLCVMELARRLASSHKPDRISFSNSSSIASHYMERMRHLEQEHFLLLLLDGKNRLIKEIELTVGTVNASLASTRNVMIEALRYNAVFFIVIHNHPSGDSTPSAADISITRKLREAGSIMDIALLDHLVIGDGCYTSICASMDS